MISQVLRIGFAAVVAWSLLPAQEFDSASIKPAEPGFRGYSIQPLPGRISAKNANLKQLIAAAYHVQDYQVAGGPKWIAADAYDVEAKAAEPEGAPGERTLMAMLQKLLEKRFSLAIHKETKDETVYTLQAAKSGVKVQSTKDTSSAVIFKVYQRHQVTAQNAPLSYLTEALSWILSHPVVDRTGLTGVYDYQLDWSPDEFQPSSAETPSLASDNPRTSLSTELQAKMGIHMTLQRAPVEIVVIDRAEKPTVN